MFDKKPRKPKTITVDGEELVLASTIDAPLLSELGPETQALAERFAAMSLPELASTVMTEIFKADYELNSQVWGALEITEHFMPAHRSPKLHETDEATPGEMQVNELMTEAMQVLEHAGLILHREHYYQLNGFRHFTTGFATTRIGRAALADGSVQARVAAVTPAS
jgi:hypothetical protein